MKKIFFLLFFFPTMLSAQMTEEQIQKAVAKPFNPYSVVLPKKEVLVRMEASRVMDMGASCYANGFMFRAIYFYKAVIELFPGDTESVSWANYELAYIYKNLFRKAKALEHLDTVLSMSVPDPIASQLAQALATRLRNPKEYRTYRRQEDVLFVEEKKQRRLDMKQIAKEEAEIRKTQSALDKENKRILKEERRAKKQADKEAKAAAKEQAKN